MGQMETENKIENTTIRWTKEIKKIVMTCFYQSNPTRIGYGKPMMKIWREIGLFKITELRLADQTRVVRTNDQLSEVKPDEIQRKIKEKQDSEEPRIELQNTYEERSHDEVDVKLMDTENVLSGLQDQNFKNDEMRLLEVIQQIKKRDKAPLNLNVERKRLK